MLPRALKRWFHYFSLGDQSFRFLFEPGPPDEVVVVDCETTGLDVAKDDIITIAAVKVRGNKILTSEKFEAIARPEAKMKAAAAWIMKNPNIMGEFTPPQSFLRVV